MAVPADLLLTHEARMNEELLPYRKQKVERNYREEAYADRLDRMRLQFEAGLFLDESPLQDYVQQVFDRILAANTVDCAYPLRIQIESGAAVNALNYGNGIISIHLGLLQRLKREDQLAFVLAHELAHSHLEHYETSLRYRLRELVDKNLQRKIKDVRRQNYNRYAHATELSRRFHYQYRASRRDFELAADSLGLVYLGRAGYSTDAAAVVLDILDDADQPLDTTTLDFAAVFDHPDFPFRERWLLSDNVMLVDADYEEELEYDRDSMRTHPDIPLRLAALPAGSVATEQPLMTDSMFKVAVSARAELELVNALYYHGQYAQSLYFALKQLQRDPDSGYLHGMVGLNLGGIHLLRKDRRYADQIPLSSTASAPDFRRLLLLLENLRLQELARLTHFYLLPRQSRYKNQETFLMALIESTYLMEDETRRAEFEKLYNELFPDGVLNRTGRSNNN